MRRFRQIVTLFFFLPMVVFGQHENIKELQEKLDKTTDPEQRYWRLHKISVYYKNNGLIDSMLETTSRQLTIAHQLNRDSLLLITYNDIATGLEIKSDYTLALEFYLKGLRLAEIEGSPMLTVPFYNNIGLIYFDMGNFQTCLDYLMKAKQILPEVEKKIKSFPNLLYVNIAETYLGLNKIDSAVAYLQRADKAFLKFKDDYSYASLLYDYGLAYEKKGLTTLADSMYRKAIFFSDTLGDLPHFADACKYYGQFLFNQGNPAQARSIAARGLAAAKASDYKSGITDITELLENVFIKLHEKDSAYYYGNQKNIYRDSIFNERKINQLQDMTFKEQVRETELQQAEEKYRYRTRIYSLLAGLGVVLVLAVILFRNNRQKQKAYTMLTKQKQEIDLQREKIEKAFKDLTSTQAQLIQSEKMASLGEVTAGIAHEIQNPMNFVNNFSEVSLELLKEFEETTLNKLSGPAREETDKLVRDLSDNLAKVNQHGKRADAIVKSMLQHSSNVKGHQHPADIEELVDEYLRFSYNSQKARDPDFPVDIQTFYEEGLGEISVVREDIGRVLLNLFNNAFYSMREKKKISGPSYEPKLSISVRRKAHSATVKGGVELSIKDNGMGIAEKNLEKIFQPFFTTKPAGQGTGLGLSLTYDIITKEHGGQIHAKTVSGESAEFMISLPAVGK